MAGLAHISPNRDFHTYGKAMQTKAVSKEGLRNLLAEWARDQPVKI